MKKSCYFIPALLVILNLPSCTIEKRHFLPGYHVEWRHGVHVPDDPEKQQESFQPLNLLSGTVDSVVPIQTTDVDKSTFSDDASQKKDIVKEMPDKHTQVACSFVEKKQIIPPQEINCKIKWVKKQGPVYNEVPTGMRIYMAILFGLSGIFPAMLMGFFPGEWVVKREFWIDCGIYFPGAMILYKGVTALTPLTITIGGLLLTISLIYTITVIIKYWPKK